MMRGIVLVCAALLSAAMPHRASAQALPQGNFETNRWVFLNDAEFPPLGGHTYQMMLYRYGTPKHSAGIPNQWHPGRSDRYFQHLAENLYPGKGESGLRSGNCITNFGVPILVDKRATDSFLDHLTKAASHLVKVEKFPSVGQNFNIVPYAAYTETADEDGNMVPGYTLTGEAVNLLLCGQSSVAAVSRIGDPDQSSMMAIGRRASDFARKPGRSAWTAGHEVMHVHQNDLIPYRKTSGSSGPGDRWIAESLAQVAGAKVAFAVHGGRDAALGLPEHDGDYKNGTGREFAMWRSYRVPLVIAHETQNQKFAQSAFGSDTRTKNLLLDVSDAIRQRFHYEGHAFFWHVEDRFLKGKTGYWLSMLIRMTEADIPNALPALDDFLDRADGRTAKGLQHVFPQFLADYAGWWETRTAGKISEDKWLLWSFGGCDEITLDETTAQGHVDIDIATLSGRCVDVVLGGDLPQRTPELELFASSDDVDQDEVYLSFARATGMMHGTVSCREILDSGRIHAREMPCVLDPSQGQPVNLATELFVEDAPVRAWRFARIAGDGSGDEIRLRLMLARVLPDEGLKSYDHVSFDTGTLRVAATVDSTKLTGFGQPEADPDPLEEPIGAIVPWADGGMMTSDDLSDPSDSMMGRVFAGGARIPGFDMNQIAPQLQAGRGFSLLLMNEAMDRDGNGVSIGMLPQREGVGIGTVGPVPVWAAGEIRTPTGSEIGIQNPDRPSKLDIYENTATSLQYQGELHLCFFTQAQLMTAIAREDTRSPCSWGTRQESYFTDTVVSLPEMLPGISRRGADVRAIPPTPEYKQLKNLRLAKIGQQLGAFYDPSEDDPVELSAAAAPAPDAQGGPSNGDSDGGGSNSSGCDCSCEGRDLIQRLMNSGELSAADKRCRLLCGSAWKVCTE